MEQTCAPARPDGGTDTRETTERPERPAADLLAVVGAAALAIAVQAVLWQRFRLPLWYDELWRPHFAAEPLPSFWSELGVANAPSALGSIALVRLCGETFGWHAWALRLPSAIPLIALAVGTLLLACRLTRRVAAIAAVVTVVVAGTIVDLASQIKPYTLDAACAVAVVTLWMGQPANTRRLVGRRVLAGVLALFSLPALFLIIPLFVLDTVRSLRVGLGQRRAHRPPRRQTVREVGGAMTRAAACAAPAVAIAGIHAGLFVAHQSGQRASTFWDDHFLAGRGPLDAVRFVVQQLAATAAGAPPGVDRYDPNLVHPLTDSSAAMVVALGCAVAITFVAGVVTLSRRADGRVLLVALGGAELMALAASAWRYWPFGAVRPNTFLVPLLTVVAAAGAAALAEAVRASWPTTPRAAGDSAGDPGQPRDGRRTRATRRVLAGLGAVILLVGAAVPVAGATGLRPLWEERGTRRPIDLMVEATVTARRLYQPGDLVLVGGRLARAGWLYGMQHSQDGGVVAGPAVPAGSAGPRVPASATVFLTAVGDGGVARALARRAPGDPAGRVLLFVLAYDRRGTDRALAEARGAGWCPKWTQDFELTGTLRVLTRCEP